MKQSGAADALGKSDRTFRRRARPFEDASDEELVDRRLTLQACGSAQAADEVERLDLETNRGILAHLSVDASLARWQRSRRAAVSVRLET